MAFLDRAGVFQGPSRVLRKLQMSTTRPLDVSHYSLSALIASGQRRAWTAAYTCTPQTYLGLTSFYPKRQTSSKYNRAQRSSLCSIVSRIGHCSYNSFRPCEPRLWSDLFQATVCAYIQKREKGFPPNVKSEPIGLSQQTDRVLIIICWRNGSSETVPYPKSGFSRAASQLKLEFQSSHMFTLNHGSI